MVGNYGFYQRFVIDSDGSTIPTGPNEIFREASSKLNNIKGIDNFATNGITKGVGGAMRFYNSNDKVIARIIFTTTNDANKFWKFYYTDVFEHTIRRLFRQHNEKHGTNYSY